jgi:hypothetical protein
LKLSESEDEEIEDIIENFTARMNVDAVCFPRLNATKYSLWLGGISTRRETIFLPIPHSLSNIY